jgi:hypothetical protein
MPAGKRHRPRKAYNFIAPWKLTMPNADQLLAKLYALRKDYADDPEDETYLALHHAFLFISYNHAAFKEYVKREAEKPTSPPSP